MSTQLVLSVSGLIFSILLLPVLGAALSKKDRLLRKYVRLCTLFYTSGTILILLITIIKPDIPLLWALLCEICAFGIYVVSYCMIFFVVKKFAEGANPPANQKTDEMNDIDKINKPH